MAPDRNNRGVSTNRIDEEKEEVAPELSYPIVLIALVIGQNVDGGDGGIG